MVCTHQKRRTIPLLSGASGIGRILQDDFKFELGSPNRWWAVQDILQAENMPIQAFVPHNKDWCCYRAQSGSDTFVPTQRM